MQSEILLTHLHSILDVLTTTISQKIRYQNVKLLIHLYIHNQPPLLRLRPLEVDLQSLPTLLIIIGLHLLTGLQRPVRHSHHQSTLKHERHASLTDLRRLQLRRTRLLMRRAVRAMSTHDIV